VDPDFPLANISPDNSTGTILPLILRQLSVTADGLLVIHIVQLLYPQRTGDLRITNIERVSIQVDKTMFEQTQRIGRAWINYVLTKYVMDIQKRFGIDWSSVEWKDLRKPLYSALGARLYVLFQSRMSDDNIPLSIEDQARFWKAHYRPDGDEQRFNTLAIKLENREYATARTVTELDGARVTLRKSCCFPNFHELTRNTYKHLL